MSKPTCCATQHVKILLLHPPPTPCARRLCDLYLPLTETPPVDMSKSSGGGSGFITGRRDPHRGACFYLRPQAEKKNLKQKKGADLYSFKMNDT